MVKCPDYGPAGVEAAVKRAVDLLGGIERFVRRDEKVLLKPNLLTDALPEKGVDTHPEVVRAVIRLLRGVTRNIVCGDSPSVWGEKKEINRVYEVSGIEKVCREEGVELVYFNQVRMVNGYPLASRAFSCDRMINIPKFKTHGFTVLTACLKNLYGLVVGMHKMKLHFDYPKPRDLSRVIVDIYAARKPDLNICDGIVAMEGDGPGSAGILKKMGLIAASADGLCLDMVLGRLMGLAPADVPTTREAVRRGLGPENFSDIEILGGGITGFMPEGFQLPRTSLLARLPPLPAFLARLMTTCLSLRPYIDASRCKMCGVCRKSCPADAICLGKGRLEIDRSRCILCLCCQETCPHNAVDLRKGFLLKLLGR